MGKQTDVGEIGEKVVSTAQEFLELAGDEELLRFLRRLPMVAGHESGKVTLKDLMYEMLLWPYVKLAWAKVDGSPGVAGRVMHLSKVYKLAERNLERDTGVRRRLKRMIDLSSFVQIYSTEGLP